MVNQSVLITMALFAVTGAVFPHWLPLKDKLHRRSLHCDVVTCMEPIVQMMEQPFNPANFDNEVAMDFLCVELYAMEECLRQRLSSCNTREPMVKVVGQTVEGVVHYICSAEGREAIITETECWVNSTMLPAAGQCQQRIKSEMYAVDADHCELINGYLNCTVDAARSECSERATRFVDRFMYYASEPTARIMFDCDLGNRITRDLMSVLKTFEKL